MLLWSFTVLKTSFGSAVELNVTEALRRNASVTVAVKLFAAAADPVTVPLMIPAGFIDSPLGGVPAVCAHVNGATPLPFLTVSVSETSSPTATVWSPGLLAIGASGSVWLTWNIGSSSALIRVEVT